jgi:iron-sulfur cluster assembly protein
MAVTLTEKAATRARTVLAKRGDATALRLAIKTVGCSGKAYVVDYAETIGADDSVFESHGVKIVVRSVDLVFLEGTEIDYARDGLNEGFRFSNPNEKGRCGCGESFNV